MQEEDKADPDEDERFWEIILYQGPLAITSILGQRRKRKHEGQPFSQKLGHFSRCQLGAPRDVKSTFEVLQVRFDTVKRPVRSLLQSFNLTDILMAPYVVLHTMIIEDERNEDFNL